MKWLRRIARWWRGPYCPDCDTEMQLYWGLGASIDFCPKCRPLLSKLPPQDQT